MTNDFVTQQTPIICHRCNKDTGIFYESFTHAVIYHDVICPHCNTIIIRANRVLCQGESK